MAWIKKSVRSGWRDVSTYLAAGWSGRLLMKRDGDEVTVEAVGLVRGEGAGGTAWTTIPGMSPTGSETPPPGLVGSTAAPSMVFAVASTQYGATIVSATGVAVGGRFSYRTARAVPSTWPGVSN